MAIYFSLKNETQTDTKNYFFEYNNDTISFDVSFNDSSCRFTSFNNQNFSRHQFFNHIDTNIYMEISTFIKLYKN